MAALPIAFDPLVFSNKLIKAGLQKSQADIIAEAHKELFELQDQNVEEKVNSICATKEDLFRVETSLRGDIHRLESDIQRVDSSLKTDIQRLELDIQQVDSSLREEFLSLKWMSKGIIAFMIVFIVPMFIKMFFG